MTATDTRTVHLQDGDVQVVVTYAIPMPTSQPTDPQITYSALGYSLKTAADVSGIGERQLRYAIQAGELAARKNGVKYLILADDLRAYLAALPVAGDDVS